MIAVSREGGCFLHKKKLSAIAKNLFLKLYGWAVYSVSQVLQMECVGNHFRHHMTYIVYYA